jgi:hypothetical protein
MFPKFARHESFRANSFAIAALTIIAWVAFPASAIEKHWNTGTGNWGAAASWSPTGQPLTGDILYMNYLVSGQRGVATVSGEGFATPTSVSIRNLNELRIAPLSLLNVGGDVIVGHDDGVGFLTLNSNMPGIEFYNGRLTVGNTMRLGLFGGFGSVNQNDGIVTISQLLRVGDRHKTSTIFPGTGRYTLNGFGVLNANRLEVGWGGDTGQFACEGEFNLGGNAVLNVSLALPEPKIGGRGGEGVFNQTGGTFNCPQRIVVIGEQGGSGIYNYSGGVTNVAGFAFGTNTAGVINYLDGPNFTTGQLQLTGGGQVLLTPGNNKTLRTTVLWLANNNAIIDLNDNAMTIGGVVEGLGGQTLRTMLTRGYNGGAWTGNGMTSSAARTDPDHNTALGHAVVSDVLEESGGVYTFRGQEVPGTYQIVKYTYSGDADLNGQVDIADLGRLASNWQSSGVWSDGDFDYSGFIDVADLGRLAGNWQQGVGSPLGPSFAEALAAVGLPPVHVPEPTVAGLLPWAVLPLRRRPKRHPVTALGHVAIPRE